jgi:hypothetical protein
MKKILPLFLFTICSTILFAEGSEYINSYSTYFGGSEFEQSRDLFVDDSGFVYIAGGTSSSDFPVTVGSYNTVYFDESDETVGNWGPMMAYVAKFSPDGDLIWSTLIGGPNYDRAYAIEVDKDGYVYLGGRAGNQFPTTKGAIQETFTQKNRKNNLYGHQNGFVCKLSPDGKELIASTYYGSDSFAFFRDIVIDDDGFVYGILNAVIEKPYGIPDDAYDSDHNGGIYDMVAVKFNQDLSDVEWASYLGGSDEDRGGPSIKVGPDKSVYVAGGTLSSDFPVSDNAIQKVHGGQSDIFVTKIAPDGKSLVYSTFIGGAENEFMETHGLYVDKKGQAYAVLATRSEGIKTTQGVLKEEFSGNHFETLIYKISVTGDTLLAATYFGGTEVDSPEGVFVDENENVYVGGMTNSDDLATTDDATFKNRIGDNDGFILKLNPELSNIEYLTYFGGTGDEAVRAFHGNNNGTIGISGQTRSTDFHVTETAFQKDFIGKNGKNDSFVSIFKLQNISSVKSQKNKYIEISPNPVQDYLQINPPQSPFGKGGSEFASRGISEIVIYNVLGEKVMNLSSVGGGGSEVAGGGQIKINVSNLPTGMYFIKIGDRVEKFVKE